ncbi:unnamed protein product [Orchesella dallaii]|uniref:Uncharacterized protein n=1 Tax=Orchesella dallaii TaxID=48710 RepID=A0ABP1QTJ9_9HEXA
MQLHVTNRSWCDYFIWSPKGTFNTRINRDKSTQQLWDAMKIKLERFWLEDIGPELINSRLMRGYKEYNLPPLRLATRLNKLKKKIEDNKENVTNDDNQTAEVREDGGIRGAPATGTGDGIRP